LADNAFTATKNANTMQNQMFKDSGITVSLPYMNVGGSNVSVRAEYSMLLADELWSFRQVAHDLSLVTTYKF
jgi:hypothetical protein